MYSLEHSFGGSRAPHYCIYHSICSIWADFGWFWLLSTSLRCFFAGCVPIGTESQPMTGTFAWSYSLELYFNGSRAQQPCLCIILFVGFGPIVADSRYFRLVSAAFCAGRVPIGVNSSQSHLTHLRSISLSRAFRWQLSCASLLFASHYL